MVRTMKRKSDVPALIKAMIVEMQGTNDVGGGSGPSSSHKKSPTIEENSRREVVSPATSGRKGRCALRNLPRFAQ